LSWNSFIRPAGAAIALAIAGTATIAAADPLVVKSSGPSARAYPPGKAIPGSARIALKAGDTVVILDGRGTRTLRGPGTFSPTIASTQLADSRDLPARASGTRARIGAVRGVAEIGESTRNPNIWFVDVGQSGRICITDAKGLTLWRGGERAPATLTVTREGDGKAQEVRWARNQSVAPWPESLPVANGARYTIAGEGGAPTTVTFALLGPNPAGLENTAALLIRSDCKAQLNLLIDTVSAPGAGGAAAQ